MSEKIKEEDLWCEYSDLPSPKSYIKCVDYDSMGNHGRFPKPKTENTNNMKKIIQKVILWFTIKSPKKKRKTIWEL
jgi:hypothetical protein